MSFPIRPELLAPAGDRDCVRAAIENGADAIYFGLECGFNARARATNFRSGRAAGDDGELHRRGVKGYVTLNTLVFPSELAERRSTSCRQSPRRASMPCWCRIWAWCG